MCFRIYIIYKIIKRTINKSFLKAQYLKLQHSWAWFRILIFKLIFTFSFLRAVGMEAGVHVATRVTSVFIYLFPFFY